MRIKQGPENEATLKLIRELPKRFGKIRAYIAHKLSLTLKEKVLAGIPNKKEYLAYRKSLRLSSIQGTGKNADAFVVHAIPKAVGVKSLDVQTTLVLITPKKGKRKGVRAAEVLRAYGPWTIDTLPYMPKASEATIQYKKVTPAEKLKTATRKKREKSKWSRDLSKAGVRVRSKREVEIGNAKALPDVALQALRLEFGLGGEKATAHWRPAQRFAAVDSVKALHTDKNLVKAFSDSKYKAWINWPPRTVGTPLKATDTKKFAGFQDKVRIRLRA